MDCSRELGGWRQNVCNNKESCLEFNEVVDGRRDIVGTCQARAAEPMEAVSTRLKPTLLPEAIGRIALQEGAGRAERLLRITSWQHDHVD